MGRIAGGNASDPDLQDQTDDFTGFIAHSVNLAFKGIIGIGAMSRPRYVSRERSPVIRAASRAAISTRSWNSDHPSGRLLTVGW